MILQMSPVGERFWASSASRLFNYQVIVLLRMQSFVETCVLIPEEDVHVPLMIIDTNEPGTIGDVNC